MGGRPHGRRADRRIVGVYGNVATEISSVNCGWFCASHGVQILKQPRGNPRQTTCHGAAR